MRSFGRVCAAPFRWLWAASVWLSGLVRSAWTNLSPRQQGNVVAWFWYTFVLSSLPILFSLGVKYIANADSHPIRWGDLYLVAALIAFAGIGLMQAGDDGGSGKPRARMNRGAATLMLGILDAVMYVAVSSSTKPHSVAVDVSSVILYILSALASLSCAAASGG